MRLYFNTIFFLGGARLPQLYTHLCKGAPPCGVCLYCSAPPLPLHHHHHTHTSPQVLITCASALTGCYLFFIISSHYFTLYPYSSIHISRKSWHTLLNTCFHIAMTTAIYAGGISLTSYPVVCQAVSPNFTRSLHFDLWHVSLMCDLSNMRQVGIALHYSSLSTLLWIGVSARVIYKEAVWRMPRQPEGESPVPPTQRPMLRSVITSEKATTPSPTSFTMRLLFAVNTVYVLDRCRSSCAWPPKLCTVKGGLCAQQP